ncbi:hypothetical protein BBW65_06580 [Helicobacter enhydrae]|uniref:DNA recombination protein RmuC n=1 Tax=Helicobacter enhydrae TaxID=222136 RepID=A0A1B1U6R0_9HELI|nr:DNA recombination protein RmuC [Helicobacter enhydrae]ANV98483.1 hypothetical protein BBW65_06580 [Helicobacter enhydrae]
MLTLLIIFATLTCLLSFVSLRFYLQSKHTSQLAQERERALQSQIQQKTQALQDTKENFANEKAQIQQFHLEHIQTLQSQYQDNLKHLKEELSKHYKEQNTALLAQNQNLINQDSKKLLNEIFVPIKEQIKIYSEGLIRNESAIKTQIESMFKYSQSVEQNANQLAKILKGDKKVRGNFGEIQLKSVLQNSGLIEGEQYKLQQGMQVEDKKYIPDAVIYLDKEKQIIIDAKFSLPTHFDFEEIDAEVCSSLLANLKSRIDELSKKPYNDGQYTYDFVLLFIPYQNILDLALSLDPSLYAYAYEKKIYLTTPHTLFMALKTIQITWIDIKRNENAQKAFEEIGKFYDKFVGVLEEFEKLKKQIGQIQNTSAELDKKLSSGSGNLASRFESLKELGAKSKKSIQF